MLNVFSCTCWPSVCLLWRNFYAGLLPNFYLGCLVFWCRVVWAVYILSLNPLSVISFSNIFSHSVSCLFIMLCGFLCCAKAFQFKLDLFGGSDHKESACNAGDADLIPGLGRPPGGEHGNPLQYSCLENPMDRRARWLQSMGSPRVGQNWVTKQQQAIKCISHAQHVLERPTSRAFLRGR